MDCWKITRKIIVILVISVAFDWLRPDTDTASDPVTSHEIESVAGSLANYDYGTGMDKPPPEQHAAVNVTGAFGAH